MPRKTSDAVPFDMTYNQALKLQAEKSRLYRDENFPPTMKSLVEPGMTGGSQPYKHIEWRRSVDIPELNDDEGKLAVFVEGVTPNDIR